MSFSDKIKKWAEKNIRLIFAILRNTRPNLGFQGFAIVTRFNDVQEVLSRDDAFNVTYASKMAVVTNGSNFFLGMGPTAVYQRDVSNMRIAIPRTDIESVIVPMVQRLTAEQIAKSDDRLDVIADLSRLVPARLMAEYMGTPGPSEEEMIVWTSNLFNYLFFDQDASDDDPIALESSAGLRQYLDQLIVERIAADEQPRDDVLGRLLRMQQAELPGNSNEDIRNNLIGILIGAIPTTSMSVGLVLDYLLSHPAILSQAQAVARNNDIATMNNYVLEALRFNPFSPGMFRECIADYTVARGTLRAKKIRKGTRVLVATLSAMWDGRKLKSPGKFDIIRSRDVYMPYGYGMHTCFGQYINDVQIAIILIAVLGKGKIKRESELQWKGSFPGSLKVSYQ